MREPLGKKNKNLTTADEKSTLASGPNPFEYVMHRKGIEEYANTVPTNPLVSVITKTYNHEHYISECLDSILAQETDFEFEIIVGEDDSADGTREICKTYADKYPDKVRLILHSRANAITINRQATGRFNSLYCLQSARGKFIAMCEGDDYWTDKKKLQKQVDILKANKDCSLVFSNLDTLICHKDGRKNIEPSVLDGKNIPQRSEIKNIVSGNYIGTCTALFRNWLLSEHLPKNYVEFPMGDWPLWLLSGRYGSYYFMNETTAIYRKHAGGRWSTKTAIDSMKQKLNALEILVRTPAFADSVYKLFKREQSLLKIRVLKSQILEYLKSKIIKKSESKI